MTTSVNIQFFLDPGSFKFCFVSWCLQANPALWDPVYEYPVPLLVRPVKVWCAGSLDVCVSVEVCSVCPTACAKCRSVPYVVAAVSISKL